MTVIPSRKLVRAAWRRGDLRYMTKYRRGQQKIYDEIKRTQGMACAEPFVLNVHRRLGKTFLGLLLCLETCLKSFGKIAKFAAPSRTQANDILDEQWAVLMHECPDDIKVRKYRDEKFYFQNDAWVERIEREELTEWHRSHLGIYGVNNDRGNKMRGGSTDTCVMDECREMPHLEYTWGSVILPTFRGRPDPLGVMLSTPPDDPDHPWCSRYMLDAKDRKRYFFLPGSLDPDWTQEDDDLMAGAMGGRETADYRREIECEILPDISRLIVPEFLQGRYIDEEGEEKNKNVHQPGEFKRPSHYLAYAVGDLGGLDHHGVLFSWIDFEKQKLIFERELWLRDTDSKTFAEAWLKARDETFSLEKEKEAGRQWVDLTERLDAKTQSIIDLNRVYGLDVGPVPTQDKEASRAMLRSGFRLGRISVSSECKETIFQLTNGTRTPKGEFARTERLGHCDLIAAMIYTYKMVDFELNPFPPKVIKGNEVFYIPQLSGGGWNRYYRRTRNKALGQKRRTAW